MVEAPQQVHAVEAGPAPLTEALRRAARGWLETMLHAELAVVLGGARHERTGARHGIGTAPGRAR